jgi:hypothetical protein
MLEKQHKYLIGQLVMQVVALDYKKIEVLKKKKEVIFTRKLILFEVVLDPNKDKRLFD